MESKTPMKKYWFGKTAPEHADAWYEYYKTVTGEGTLDKKTKELVAVAVSSIMRCTHCVKAHSKEAEKAGASKEEIAEALTTAAFMASATQLFWMAGDMDKMLARDE
jgi:AhpD family alkylhydroperoxidase